jgi:glutamyl-tRNA synthetase
MTVIVRVAPSPTGRLHFGNLRATVLNWLYAKKHGGKFMLRIDDTDLARSTKAFDQSIQDDLTWLGATWDIFARQSERFARYDEAITQLKAAGRLYPCFESEEELGLMRKSLLSRGKPPVYDRGALKLSDAERAALEATGKRPHWRFKLNDEPVQWVDGVRGQVTIPVHDLSDPVVIREDGSLLYMLASCVDDLDYGITDVIRGEDHVSNTAAQIQMFEALGGRGCAPRFAHYPHVTGKEGQKFSKRLGSIGVAQLRDELKIEPMAIWGLLARIGTSQPVDPELGLDDLAAQFELSSISRTPPKFDPDDLVRLNNHILHKMPWPEAEPKLREVGLTTANETFWLAIRGNIGIMEEALDWWKVAHEPLAVAANDEDGFLQQAASMLPPEPWTADTWKQWTGSLKEKTGRSGKALFMPLRVALTGQEHGPELGALLPLLGRERAIGRLTGKAA